MRRRDRRVAMGLLAMAVAACGRAPDAPEPFRPVALERDGGRFVVRYPDGVTVDVPSEPKRIVSTLPGLTELVAALGAADRLVGVSPWCDVPEGVDDPTRISVHPVNHEALAVLEPDLVLLDRVLQPSAFDELRRRVPGTLALSSRSLDEVEDGYRVLGEILDATPAAAALSQDLRAAVREARAATPVGGRSALLVAQPDPLNVLGPGALLDDVLGVVGLENVAADLGRASGPFSEELVLARGPAWIFVIGGDLPPAVRDRWARVPAVEAGRVVVVETNDLIRWGPRTPRGIRRLGRVVAGVDPVTALAGAR